MTNTPPTPRSKPVLYAFFAVAGLTLLLGLVMMFRQAPRNGHKTGSGQRASLTVYCAAGLRSAVEPAARQFERESGARIQINYGGSQTLLANAEVSGTGDVFIPADESYVSMAQQKNLTAESVPLARMEARLVVKKGSPIRTLADLGKEAKISQANPDAAAIGKVVREALSKSSQWEKIAAQTMVFKGTVNDVVNDVALGAADATFAWDALEGQYPGLDFLRIKELEGAAVRITAAVLNTTREPSAALQFLRFLAAPEKGQQHLQTNGFKAIPGDPWKERPELTLSAGAMLRPAIDQTVAEFEKREGVRINRVYNGCGILVAEMQTGKHPDVYFSCDTTFMNQVTDLFATPATVSGNQLVILVHKGNPHGIKSLRDLGKPGLRLGVGHEKQCALGALTRTTLLTNGNYLDVRKNVAVESPTGDFLVNQLRAKSLDAVIAYISNAAGSAEELDAISIDIPCAVAAQPIAVAKHSKMPQLSARLIAALRSPESRRRFEVNGFNWLDEHPGGARKPSVNP